MNRVGQWLRWQGLGVTHRSLPKLVEKIINKELPATTCIGVVPREERRERSISLEHGVQLYEALVDTTPEAFLTGIRQATHVILDLFNTSGK